MTTAHGRERRQRKEEAFQRGHKDGTSGSLDGRSHYNDKPEERACYVHGYQEGEKAVERWRRADVEAELDQKHEEKIDQLILGLLALIMETNFTTHSVHLEHRKTVKGLLLELIPRT